jgi:hypothetical protein
MRLLRIVLVLFPLLAWAVEPANVQTTAQIQDSGVGSAGLISINTAAGQDHQQINARAIAIGEHATSQLILQQKLMMESLSSAVDAHSEILGASFSQSNGLIGVNQAAGAGNQQINAYRLRLGAPGQALDDSVLSQQNVAAPANLSGSTHDAKGTRAVITDNRAFTGSRGVVQLNQSAGVGNRSVNNLSFTVVD